jgi:endonuclease-3
MHDANIANIVQILERELGEWELPIVTALAEDNRGPFPILISTVLSSRTKDEVTAQAAGKLLSLAGTPEEMRKLSEDQISRAIYPVGFYRNKSRTIPRLCSELIDRFHSQVPDTMEQLLTLPGVGRNPGETEYALREKLPKQYWARYNTLLVAFGRHLCFPVSPFCSRCPVSAYCDRVGVDRSR